MLPADKYSSQVVLHEGLLQTAHDAAVLVGELERAGESWAVPLIGRFQLLRENLERLARNFEAAFDLKRAHVRHMTSRVL